MTNINKTLWCALKYNKINLIMRMCNIVEKKQFF